MDITSITETDYIKFETVYKLKIRNDWLPSYNVIEFKTEKERAKYLEDYKESKRVMMQSMVTDLLKNADPTKQNS